MLVVFWGIVNGYSLAPQNVASLRTSGLDVAVSWNFTPAASLGRFNLHVVGNYLRTLKRIASPGADVENQAPLGRRR